jgi:uncharacterized protein YgiM (DUF1202 family)
VSRSIDRSQKGKEISSIRFGKNPIKKHHVLLTRSAKKRGSTIYTVKNERKKGVRIQNRDRWSAGDDLLIKEQIKLCQQDLKHVIQINVETKRSSNLNLISYPGTSRLRTKLGRTFRFRRTAIDD